MELESPERQASDTGGPRRPREVTEARSPAGACLPLCWLLSWADLSLGKQVAFIGWLLREELGSGPHKRRLLLLLSCPGLTSCSHSNHGGKSRPLSQVLYQSAKMALGGPFWTICLPVGLGRRVTPAGRRVEGCFIQESQLLGTRQGPKPQIWGVRQGLRLGLLRSGQPVAFDHH